MIVVAAEKAGAAMNETINVTRSSMPSFEEYCTEIRELWDTRWLTNNGVKHEALRAKLTKYLSVPHIDLLTNGHMAIELSLQALGLHGEVITTPFTFASTTTAIVRSGLTPVFCDVDPNTYCMDAVKLEDLISSNTCAIVPVHVYGNICDVEAIDDIAKRHGLKVLYDAAHAFGVRYRGRGIASYGDVSCFSFHATKVFHTVEGGAACFTDEEFGRQLFQLKNFGLPVDGTENAVLAGANAKMNEFSAAMGLCNLRHIEESIQKRAKAVNRYRTHLDGVEGLQLMPKQRDVEPNYAYFPVVFHQADFGADRDKVFAALRTQSINARKYFYPLTSTFPCWNGKYDAAKTPTALRISENVLCLPLYADLENNMIDRICEIILNCRH